MAQLKRMRHQVLRYPEALDFVFRFADLERQASQVHYREFHLERVRALLAAVGDPHLALPTAHVAGTKGKGSTVRMIGAVLEGAGLRPGIYTSPHLHSVRERIAVGGAGLISESAFAHCVERLAPLADHVSETGGHGRLTTFELLTAVAFLHFVEAGARSVVLEVGLGGRLDATNVAMPLVCGITNISLDHTEVLGHTLAAIAGEKAGIIKPGVPVVSGPQPQEALEVIERVAREKGSKVHVCGRDIRWELGDFNLDGQQVTVTTNRADYDLWIPLIGDYQAENAATAIGMCERLIEVGLPISADAIRQGMASVSWPGRLEVLRRKPLIVADGAHNPYSVKRLMEQIKKYFTFQHLIMVLGVTRAKDLDAMMREMAGMPYRVIATQSRNSRALPAADLASALQSAGMPAEATGDTASAMQRATELAGPGDLILVTGSLFVAAEAREELLGIQPEAYAFPSPAAIKAPGTDR